MPLAVRLLCCLLLVMPMLGCERPPRDAGRQRLPLAIAAPLQPSSALLHLAIDRGFFQARGLDVSVSYFAAGKQALATALRDDQFDLVATTGIPLVHHCLDDAQLRIIAAINMSDNLNRVVARRTSGIQALSELSGKRVATQHNSAVHYFAHLVLEDVGIDESSVDMVFYDADSLPRRLASAEFDAFVMREPYVSQAVALLADDAVVFEAPGLYRQFEVVVAVGSRVSRESMQRVLFALLDAEAFAREYPEEALSVLAQRLGADLDGLRRVWEPGDSRVELDQSMLSALDHAARWVDAVNDRRHAGLDTLKYLDMAPLLAVRPQRMTVIQ